jgi:hypothetical protein
VKRQDGKGVMSLLQEGRKEREREQKEVIIFEGGGLFAGQR